MIIACTYVSMLINKMQLMSITYMPQNVELLVKSYHNEAIVVQDIFENS